MNRIIIDVTKAELDFMREAIVLKHVNLMSYLQTCEENIQNAEKEIEKAQATPTEVVKDAIDFNVFPNKKRRRGRPRLDELPF
jgi:hypothetical protein